MQKDIVGDWGAALDDGDYACALAALGVLESSGTRQHRKSSDPAVLTRALQQEFMSGERTPVWRDAYGHDLTATIDSWRESVHEDAAALAAAWRAYRTSINHDRQKPKLSVVFNWRNRPDLFAFDDLCAWLYHDDVGLDALVLSDWRKQVAAVPWHWPLRAGVLLDTDQMIFAALRDAQDDHPWVRSLSRCYYVGGSRDSCDLLILTQDAADKILSENRTRIRARFVVCLWEPPPHVSLIGEAYGELRDRLHAIGLAVVGRPDKAQDLNEWFTSVVHDVSHDVPIHAAVGAARYRALSPYPLMLGQPSRLDACRILGLAARQDALVDLLAHDEIETPSTTNNLEFEPTFRGLEPESPAPPAQPPPESLKTRLVPEYRNRMFSSESVDGERSVEELKERQEDIERRRRPRWIQANAWRRPDARALEPGNRVTKDHRTQSLVPGEWNLLAIHIGPSERQRSDAAFPERYVDFRAGSVAATVQVELSGTDLAPLEADRITGALLSAEGDGPHLVERLIQRLPESQSGEKSAPVAVASSPISLPPAGNSSFALFGVRPQEHVKQVEGRISIFHNNRVLQTASLSIKAGDAPFEGSAVSVVAEAPIHPSDDDLDDRREYDVAIQVSDIGGKLHLTIQEDGEVTTVQLDDLSTPINSLRKALEQATVNWDESKSMFEQETFPDNLYSIAAYGSDLEQHLRKKCGDRIDNWERIHLVPATNEFLPLEYVYDGTPPDTEAQMCPNLLGALERESCEKALPSSTGFDKCPNRKSADFVCPMHFWGFRKLIERSGTIQPASASSEIQPAQVCVPSKQPYGRVRRMLFAASDKAFLFENDPVAREAARKDFIDSLGKISIVSAASDWNDWRQEVKNKPNLLMLVVHSQQFRGAPAIEIGDQRFLGRQQIKSDLSGAEGQPQLLVLLGCSVASVNENFQPYPERFRDAGVSIVIAPVATIRGMDAVPIARRIGQIIADRVNRPEPTAFGDLLPLLRRELLRQGHPGVMSIVGFGDGDWLLGGE